MFLVNNLPEGLQRDIGPFKIKVKGKKGFTYLDIFITKSCILSFLFIYFVFFPFSYFILFNFAIFFPWCVFFVIDAHVE